jgi:hypothetical protein
MPASAPPPGSATRHPSAKALHEYHLALADRAAADGIAAHVAGCDRCRADLEALGADQARFEREIFPRTRAAIEARATRWWRRPWALPALGGLAAAAALLVFVRPHDDIRAKGAAALAVFVARGDGVQPVENGASHLHAGDRIRFVLWPNGLKYAVIASIDGAAHATIYYPFHGDRSATLAPGPRVEVPGSIELDDAPGPERVFAVLSARPLDTAPVLAALKKLSTAAAVRRTATLPIEAATVTSLLFERTP